MKAKTIRLGILGCADIAGKRFLPAAREVDGLQVVAIAEEYDRTRLEGFCRAYELEAEESFDALVRRPDLHAVYVPQPPALHYRWAREALLQGKHVLVEKPSTTDHEHSRALVSLASERGLALHENYMFQYHAQLGEIRRILAQGSIGDIRLLRADFGFPMRKAEDFRYNRRLGGGALLDAGGYALKLATLFLGETVRVDTASLFAPPGFDVDLYGSASLSNADGAVCQIAFGMDCSYRCALEVWGSTGRLLASRIFTAPDGFVPEMVIEGASGTERLALPSDSHFRVSIEKFLGEISSTREREGMYREILLQSRLVDDVRNFGGADGHHV